MGANHRYDYFGDAVTKKDVFVYAGLGLFAVMIALCYVFGVLP